MISIWQRTVIVQEDVGLNLAVSGFLELYLPSF
jgi:hypothetical protein